MKHHPSKKISINKSHVLESLLSLGAVVFAALFMPIFMYSANSIEADIGELVMPLILFPLVAIAMLFVFSIFTKSLSKAAMITILMTLALENYAVLERWIRYLLPMLKYWHVLPIVVAIVLHVGYVLHRFVKKDIAQSVSMIALLVFGGLTMINLVTAIPNMVNRVSSTFDNVSVDQNQETVDTNIYYFILDEGASFKTLKNYYDYEASDFINFLEDNNFNIAYETYNQSGNTRVMMTDLLNLNYVAKDTMDANDLNKLNVYPLLREVLESNGYDYNGVGDTEWLYIPSLTVHGGVEAKTIDGETILQLVMKNTFLYPCYNVNINEAQKVIHDAFDYYNGDVYDKKRQFRFTYLCSPHQPFLFDENGNSVSESHFADWSDEKYYLNQYRYIMKCTTRAVSQILENDPNSIIVIASDHGPRFNPEMEYKEKLSVLHCVYYKGEKLDIEGKTIIESMRLILEKLLETKLPELEVRSNG